MAEGEKRWGQVRGADLREKATEESRKNVYETGLSDIPKGFRKGIRWSVKKGQIIKQRNDESGKKKKNYPRKPNGLQKLMFLAVRKERGGAGKS